MVLTSQWIMLPPSSRANLLFVLDSPHYFCKCPEIDIALVVESVHLLGHLPNAIFIVLCFQLFKVVWLKWVPTIYLVAWSFCFPSFSQLQFYVYVPSDCGDLLLVGHGIYFSTWLHEPIIWLTKQNGIGKVTAFL